MVGLLLLLCKDLITGDLPVGGTSAVGRGVFTGTATVEFPGVNPITFGPDTHVAQDAGQLLNKYVAALSKQETLE